MKYCLENMKITEMVKDMDAKYGGKDDYIPEEAPRHIPHFYTKKNIYGYIFILDLTDYKDQWDIIKEYLSFIRKKEIGERKYIETKKVMVCNKKDLLPDPEFKHAKKFL